MTSTAPAPSLREGLPQWLGAYARGAVVVHDRTALATLARRVGTLGVVLSDFATVLAIVPPSWDDTASHRHGQPARGDGEDVPLGGRPTTRAVVGRGGTGSPPTWSPTEFNSPDVRAFQGIRYSASFSPEV